MLNKKSTPVFARQWLNSQNVVHALMKAMGNHPRHEGIRNFTSAALLHLMSDEGNSPPKGDNTEQENKIEGYF